MTSSPLIVGNLVIVNAGIDPDKKAGRALAAYDRASGVLIWAGGNDIAGYSSPQLAQLDGSEQILLFDGGGLAGFDPKSGSELWRYPWKTFSDMNIMQPLVLGEDQVFISSEMSNGCALLQVKKKGERWAVDTVWKNKLFGARFANPVAADGHIYGLSNGILTCLEQETGKRTWKGGRFGSGQVLLAGKSLLITSEMGEVMLMAADPKEYRELARMTVFSGKTWNTPALAGNQLFVRNHREMACYELPTADSGLAQRVE